MWKYVGKFFQSLNSTVIERKPKNIKHKALLAVSKQASSLLQQKMHLKEQSLKTPLGRDA